MEQKNYPHQKAKNPETTLSQYSFEYFGSLALWLRFYSILVFFAIGLIYFNSCIKDEDDIKVETGNFSDPRDGQTYKWVKLGTQVWMTENLRYLPGVVGAGTGSRTTPYYYVYDYVGTNVTDAKATSNYTAYGVLYNWPAAMAGSGSSSANPSGIQGACPPGWHIPSDSEWKQLVNYIVAQGYPNELDSPNMAGNALKSCRQINSPLGGECNTSDHPRWISDGSKHYGTDNFGFSALPGGYRFFNGLFIQLGQTGKWWSATESHGYYEINADYALFRYMFHNHGSVGVIYFDKEAGFSVRCVRN